MRDPRTLETLVPRYRVGYADSVSNPRRCAMCGYLASSREKFLRALAGEMFGNALGCRPINAHRCIFLASRCSRICGRACNSIFLLRKFPFCALRDRKRKPFLQQVWQFRATRETSSLAGTTKMRPHAKHLIVAELTRNGAAKAHRRSLGPVLLCMETLSFGKDLDYMRASLGGRDELAARVQQALALPTKKEAEHVVDAVIAELGDHPAQQSGHGRIHAEARQLRQVLCAAQAGDSPEDWVLRDRPFRRRRCGRSSSSVWGRFANGSGLIERSRIARATRSAD